MEEIRYEGWAYENGEHKLFPLVAKNADGTVNTQKTCRVIQEAARWFDAATPVIPSEQIDNVRSQILGAAQSHGLTVLLQ